MMYMNKAPKASITLQDDVIHLEVPYIDNIKARSCGARWNATKRVWTVKATRLSLSAINHLFSESEISNEVKQLVKAQVRPTIEYPAIPHQNHLLQDVVMRPSQVKAYIDAWEKEAYALFHVMGCVSGDTEVQVIQWSGKGKKMKISDLYEWWVKSEKPLKARALVDDQFNQHKVLGVLQSGIKTTYTLTLSDGKTLRATPDHEILTPDGWVELQNLIVGDSVVINGRVIGGTVIKKPDKDGYIRVRIPQHPRAWKSAKVVYQHILVMENHLNRYLEDGEVVHHVNGIENLQLMTKSEHLAGHGHDYRRSLDGGISSVSGGKVVVVPKTAQVVSIELFGEEMTYDLSMESPHNNFVANGIVVHNCGKTLTSIAIANGRRLTNQIDAVLIICPTSIKGVWKKEYQRYSKLVEDVQVFEAGRKVRKFDGFPVMVVGVEGLSTGGTAKVADDFIKKNGNVMVILDESSSIKNHSAKRTEKAIELAHKCSFRLILTGTNVTQGLIDLYSQMYFLDPTIIGEISFYSFRSRYCVMGGFESRKLIGYTNVEQLFDRIRPYCDVITKGDVKDLPPKQYQIREVKATPEQVRCCRELVSDMKTQLGDGVLEVKNALEAMTRIQQICGGHDQHGEPLHSNPKLTELMNLLSDFGDKAIIWARYLPEIKAITKAIEKQYPGSCVVLTGAVPPEERQALVDKFQSDPTVRFFITNQMTGGRGITLTAATLSVYFSNTFSLEDRLQSEDRCHRIGQLNAVTYVDLISNLKVDQQIADAIVNKKSVYEYANSNLKLDDLF